MSTGLQMIDRPSILYRLVFPFKDFQLTMVTSLVVTSVKKNTFNSPILCQSRMPVCVLLHAFVWLSPAQNAYNRETIAKDRQTTRKNNTSNCCKLFPPIQPSRWRSLYRLVYSKNQQQRHGCAVIIIKSLDQFQVPLVSRRNGDRFTVTQ